MASALLAALIVALAAARAPDAQSTSASPLAGAHSIDVLLLRPEGFAADYFTAVLAYVNDRVQRDGVLPGWLLKWVQSSASCELLRACRPAPRCRAVVQLVSWAQWRCWVRRSSQASRFGQRTRRRGRGRHLQRDERGVVREGGRDGAGGAVRRLAHGATEQRPGAARHRRPRMPVRYLPGHRQGPAGSAPGGDPLLTQAPSSRRSWPGATTWPSSRMATRTSSSWIGSCDSRRSRASRSTTGRWVRGSAGRHGRLARRRQRRRAGRASGGQPRPRRRG